MKPKLWKILGAVVSLLGIAMMIAFYLIAYSEWGLNTVTVDSSPDADYRVVILKRWWRSKIPTGIGQGSDAPGIARLVNEHGQIIREEPLGMVQEGFDVEWKQKSVRVGDLRPWALPVSDLR